MPAVSLSTAQAAAIQIRDETAIEANTATRVGGAMLNQAESVLYSGLAAALPERTIQRENGAGGTGILAGLVLRNPTIPGPSGDGNVNKHSPTLVHHTEVFSSGNRYDSYVRTQLRSLGPTIEQHYVISMGTVLQSSATTPDTASLTDEYDFSATALDIKDNALLTTGYVAITSAPATSGGLRLGDASVFGAAAGVFFNNAGTPVQGLLAVSGVLVVGANGANGVSGVIYETKAGFTHNFSVDGASQMRVETNVLDFHNGANTNFAIRGNAEAMIGLNIAGSGVRNLALFNDGSAGMQSMDGGVYIANRVAAPTGNPTGGGYLSVNSGALEYRATDGVSFAAGGVTINYTAPTLQWTSAVAGPVITQAAASSGDGQTLSILGQPISSTGTNHGGDAVLVGGACTATSGALTGGVCSLQGGSCTQTTVGTSQTGGAVLIRGGGCSGTSGTRQGGHVDIRGGTGNGGTDGATRIMKPDGTVTIQVNATGIGVFGATPVAQPSSTGETVGFTAGGGTTVTDASTFTGNVGTKAYRISDIVKHLKNLGWLASS